MQASKVINIQYRTQRQQLNKLSKKEYVALRELCYLSKNMYNVALYSIRQNFFKNKKILSYVDNYHLIKDNENYQELNSNMAQQIIKEVHGAFSSFFGLLKSKKAKTYEAKVNIPKYLDKEGYFSLIIAQIRIKDSKLRIPMSPSFKRLFGNIDINVPSNLKDKTIKEIRVIPKSNARFFEIQYIYEVEESQRELNQTNILAIDFGVNNLATCVTNNGKSFIIDGKKLKSINQRYNKNLSKMQSIRDKLLGVKRRITKREFLLINKRNNRVRDYINKTARLISNYCVENDIGTIVVGRNKGIKNKINIGKKNNQSFVQIPISLLAENIKHICNIENIKYVEQEESYTSKADFFNDDEVPVYKENNVNKYVFTGQRISRGQYKSDIGITINADINGALNILKKSNLESSKLRALQAKGKLDMPLRIKVS